MKLRWLLFAAAPIACAADAAHDGDVGPPDQVSTDLPDAASSDAGSEDRPCFDCEYFPETCSADTLCPNGPFGSDDPERNFDLRTSIETIRGRSPSDVWVTGSVGAAAHFDGASWRLSELGGQETVSTLWLRDDATEVALVSRARILARGIELLDAGVAPSRDGWTTLFPSYAVEAPSEIGTKAILGGWAAPGAEWLWFVTGGRLGGTTQMLRLRRSTPTAFEGAVGISEAVGVSAGCNNVISLHGSTPDALWAVGHGGRTARVTNAQGEAPLVKAFDSLTMDALFGVWEASSSEAWSVGARGTIRRYSGDSALWDIVPDVPTTVHLRAVWGSSPADVWAVGDEAVVLHFDGTRWARVKVAGLGGERPALTTVWVASPDHVWIGGKGVVLSLGGKP